MRNHTVEIGDRNGQSFKIHISTPSILGKLENIGDKQQISLPLTGAAPSIPVQVVNNFATSEWRAIDKGYIRFNSGKLVRGVTYQDLTTVNVYLFNLDGTWGMQLFEYEDMFGVNDQGAGFIIQPWSLKATVGKFSWSLVD